MAKKRKKRRSPQRPNRPRQQAAGAGGSAETGPDAAQASARGEERDASQSPSRRAERKEEARRERERRMKQARRRQRTRRLVRWATTLAVIAGVVLLVIYIQNRGKVDEGQLATAAERLNCTEVEEQDAEQTNQHAEPYDVGEGGVPSFGGNHNGTYLPADPKVYDQATPEDQAVHNLEHGYVLIYYANEGDGALSEELISGLEDLAEGETEILMSPYPELAQPVTFVAWGARQSCDPPENASSGDAALVAQGFIDEWKNGQFAPEPSVP